MKNVSEIPVLKGFFFVGVSLFLRRRHFWAHEVPFWAKKKRKSSFLEECLFLVEECLFLLNDAFSW
jgi:hypothetical protein